MESFSLFIWHTGEDISSDRVGGGAAGELSQSASAHLRDVCLLSK